MLNRYAIFRPHPNSKHELLHSFSLSRSDRQNTVKNRNTIKHNKAPRLFNFLRSYGSKKDHISDTLNSSSKGGVFADETCRSSAGFNDGVRPPYKVVSSGSFSVTENTLPDSMPITYNKKRVKNATANCL